MGVIREVVGRRIPDIDECRRMLSDKDVIARTAEIWLAGFAETGGNPYPSELFRSYAGGKIARAEFTSRLAEWQRKPYEKKTRRHI
ncbi:MAG: hypothetical protein IJP61_03935 [Treponema sp.]|nr:hypothetical protein [Treponema sp.]